MSRSSNGDCESLINSGDESDSSFPVVDSNPTNVFVTMEAQPILNDQDDAPCFSAQRDGYLVIQTRDLRECPNLGKQLKYPKNIDPFKITPQIVLLSLIIVFICILFGISFALTHIGKIRDYLEFGICGLVCVQFMIMMVYYSFSVSWCSFLSDSGYYDFPKKIIAKRTLVIFLWGVGAFLFSPVQLAINIYCRNGTDNYVKLAKTNLVVTDYELMQLYLGLESLLVLFGLCWHLAVIVQFKLQRRWPDIWHERLLEESALISWCPLITLSELRIEITDDIVTVEHDRVLDRPTEADIMQKQAYVIGYLRKLNSRLSSRINELSRDLKNDLVTRVLDTDPRSEDHMESSSIASSSNIPSYGSKKGRHTSLLS